MLFLKNVNILHTFICIFIQIEFAMQLYSVAKFHKATISSNKEGVACFSKNKIGFISEC